jgi:hypothetical protein
MRAQLRCRSVQAQLDGIEGTLQISDRDGTDHGAARIARDRSLIITDDGEDATVAMPATNVRMSDDGPILLSWDNAMTRAHAEHDRVPVLR